MARCLASVQITPDMIKRCIRDNEDDHQHLWVEATTTSGTAWVVRWDELSKQPCEILRAELVERTVNGIG